MRPSLFLAALALLCACATRWDQGWAKPGADHAEFKRERCACLQDIGSGRGAGLFGYDSADKQRFASCMQQRGWQRDTSE